MSSDIDSRLTALEETMYFQEEKLKSLEKHLLAQQNILDALERHQEEIKGTLDALRDMIESARPGAANASEIPPHYQNLPW